MPPKTVSLPSGGAMPALGQGTWMMGAATDRAAEIAALRLGLDLGMTLIDTAEMYSDGDSETLVGEAIAGRREEVFLVSKASPQNTGRGRLAAHCEASLKRLRTDRLDLYLVHWRGGPPLDETVKGMEALKARGLVRQWGVSNFDVDDMRALFAAGGEACAANQIYYTLDVRGPEFDLIPWMAERAMPVMAYSPIGQGALLRSPALRRIAQEAGAEPAQLTLAWLLHRQAAAIPKAADPKHVRANAGAANVQLSPETVADLDAAFPPPTRKTRLQLI